MTFVHVNYIKHDYSNIHNINMVKYKMHKNKDLPPTNHVQYSNHFRLTLHGFGDFCFCGVGA